MPNGPTLLWTPSEDRKLNANITRYIEWLYLNKGVQHDSYHDLWEWSVTNLKDFWGSLVDFFDVKFHKPYDQVLDGRDMPGARWFTNSTLNYAEHSLRRRDQHPAIVFQSELRQLKSRNC